MTRGHDGLLVLSCIELSSTTPCRFIPAHYRSRDYGANWKLLTEEIPGGPANVVKQDPAHKNILYIGTDRGVYVSTDSGAKWHVIGKGLPTAYVHDLAVQTVEDYLVAATHGRGHWVLDIRPLR